MKSPIIAEYLLKYGAIAYLIIWKIAIYRLSDYNHPIELLLQYRSPTRDVLRVVKRKNNKEITELFARSVSSFGAADYEQRKMLIDAGGKINALDAHGRTALFYVNEPDVIKPLIEAGIDPGHIDNEGKTALFYLGTDDPNNILIADKLIKCGVDPDICDRDGQQAPIIQNYDRIKKQYALDRELDDAVSHDNFTKAQDVLQSGADPNCLHRHQKRWNMLMLVNNTGSPQMLELLLEYGADPNQIVDDDTALNNAQFSSRAILNVYREYGYELDIT